MPSALVPHRHGYVMVFVCQCWYWGGWTIYNFLNLPEMRRQLRELWPAAEPLATLVGVLFNTIWLLAVLSFFRTHCSTAGGITDPWRHFVRKQELDIFEPRFAWQPAQATWCSKCQDVRPERTHHCSSVNECVLRFDHYCPWTANSIGHWNHKFFLLVAFYTFFANLIAFVTMVPVALQIVLGWLRGEADPQRWDHPVLMIATVFEGVILYRFFEMCRDHFKQAYHNITTVETNYKNMPNPYDLGSKGSNLPEMFGKFGPDWFLPVLPWSPVSDGLSFQRCCEPTKARTEEMAPDALLHYRYVEVGPMEESFEESSSEGSSEQTDD